MSSVYHASGQGEYEGSQFALKTCRRGTGYEKALRKEYDILCSINSKYVPEVFGLYEYRDSFAGEEYVGIVMEYIRGRSLSDILRNGDRDTPEEDVIKNVISAVCSVLSDLHSMKEPVYYCDVKPDNIIICDDVIKIIDFGSGRYSGPGGRMKDDAVRYGTVSYAAPEQFDTSKEIDARTDIYGIGKLLGIIYDNKKIMPKGMKRIIKKCTYNEQKRRYGDISEFVNDYLRCTGEKGIIKSVIIYR